MRHTPYDVDLEFYYFQGTSYSTELVFLISNYRPITDNRCVFIESTATKRLPGFAVRAEASEHALSDKHITKIKNWIAECNNKHPLCGYSTDLSSLPTRVIDVSQSDKQLLFETGGNRGQYIALSHRWDDAQLPLLTTLNLQQLKLGFSSIRLTRRFKDAIAFTRALGINYLWIDCLCILQDSARDWEIQPANMASVYRNSYVTICVSGFQASSDGFVSRPRFKSWEIDVNMPSDEIGRVKAQEAIHHELFYGSDQVDTTGNPLSVRGWAFQERILSRRVLHFTEYETTYECDTGTWCECGRLEMKSRVAHDMSSHSIQKYASLFSGTPDLLTWHDVVSEYSTKCFTKDEDVLPALSGIASKVQSKGSGRYFAGLWENDFLASLVWVATDMFDANDFRKATRPLRPSSYRGPSWSWVAVQANIEWKFSYQVRYFVVRVQEVECTVLGANPFGKVSSGRLEIFGLVVEALLEIKTRTGPPNYESRSYSLSRDGTSISVDSYHLQIDTQEDADEADGSKIFCLLMREYAPGKPSDILLLKPDGVSSSNFRRIGICNNGHIGSSMDVDQSFYDVSILFEGATRTEIVIV